MDENTANILITATTTVGSLLAPLIVSISSWFSKKSIESQKNNFLRHATKEIEFLKTCLDFYDQYGSEVEAKRYERETTLKLNLLLDQFNQFHSEETARIQRKQEGLKFYQRAFLLFKPVNLAGWIWRISFYLFLGFIVFYIFGVSVPDFLLFGADERGNSVYLSEYAMGDAVGIFIIGIVPMLLFRFLAIRTYRRNHSQTRVVENDVADLAPAT